MMASRHPGRAVNEVTAHFFFGKYFSVSWDLAYHGEMAYYCHRRKVDAVGFHCTECCSFLFFRTYEMRFRRVIVKLIAHRHFERVVLSS